jgi:4-diphosphocytidyl-2-C-methyl-D-erythritol kinase
MEHITLSAPAKINLSLRILRKRPDGYHELETLMAPLTLCDEVEVTHGVGTGIIFLCNDPDLPTGADNLCVKAAEAFRTATGLEHGIAISLMKRIPHGAGLGGGSSDAGAVLRGLNELFDHPLVPEELHQIATQLGSDIPFFLQSGPAWCRGRGEILESAEPLPERALLLIKPPFPVPTPWAYKRYAEMRVSNSMPQQEVQKLDNLTLLNDLELPVFEKYLLLPVMKKWLRAQPGVESAFMTGSGSTMVAIMEPGTSGQSLITLKEKIGAEFGPTMRLIETSFFKV